MSLSYVVDGETELDSELFNPIIDRVNGDAGPLANMRAGTVNILDYDSEAAALAAIPSGGTFLLPPGEYDFGSSLTLSKPMTLMGYGAVLPGCTVIVSSDDVTVRGVTSTDSTMYGFYSDKNRTSFIDCTAIDSANIGIFINIISSGGSIVDAQVRGCYVDRSSLDPATIVEGGIKVHGYALGPYTVSGDRITGNVVRMPSAPTSDAAICIEVWGGAPYSVISNNTTFDGAMGISLNRSNYSSCTGNVCVTPSLIGIENAGSKGLAISGNSIYGNGALESGISVSYTDPDNIAIAGNLIQGCTTNGIRATGAENVGIAGNTIVGQTGGYGINIIGCDGVSISGNMLAGSGGLKAAVLDTTQSASVCGNTMKDWTQHGVLVYAATAVTLDNITVDGNIFDNCNVPYGTSLSGGAAIGTRYFVQTHRVLQTEFELDGALNHDGSTVGFYGTAPVAQQTGVAVSAAGVHTALVNLGLITA